MTNRDSLAALPPIAERVSAGIDLLDRECRGWDKHIDLARLQLDCCRRCVLGQLFRSFSLGLDELDLDDDDAVRLGFDTAADDDGIGYDHLTGAWIAAIRARREVAG